RSIYLLSAADVDAHVADARRVGVGKEHEIPRHEVLASDMRRRDNWSAATLGGFKPTAPKTSCTKHESRRLAATTAADVRDVCPRYDADTGARTGGREPTTWASYEIFVRRHIKPYLGKITLAKLQVERVERWQTQLEAAGASAETRRASLVR